MTGRRIEDALNNKGMKRSELADLLHISRPAVSQWIAGTKEPTVENLQKIMEILGGDVEWYAGREGEAPEVTPEQRAAYAQYISWYWREAPRDGGKDYDNSRIWAFPFDLEVLVREALQNIQDAAFPLGRPVRAEFRLIRLTGIKLLQFLDALQWVELEKHVRAAAVRDSQMTRILKLGLEAIRSGELLLLRVQDSGTTGLLGSEIDGNFAKLIRNNLDSDKDPRAGGSYGLGKAVFWRSSLFATVVFNSNLGRPQAQPDGSIRQLNRLIAKADLGWHEVDGEPCAGPGWLSQDDEQNNQPASSIWDNSALARDLYVDRPGDLPGTSILVPGFYNPDPDEQLTVEELAGSLRRSIARNFWPALLSGRMEVSVSTAEADDVRTNLPVEVDRYQPEFADAIRKYHNGEVKQVLKEEGDVAVIPVPLAIPARKTDPKHQAFEHEAMLIVRRDAEGIMSEDTGTAVMYRSPEMVISRLNLTSLMTGAPPFHAAVLCGLAAGDTQDDKNAEHFLRTAEPPAHNRWDHKLLAGTYERGGGAAIQKFTQAIREEIRKLVKPVVEEDAEGPQALRELLRLTGGPKDGIKLPKVVFLRNKTRLRADGVWHVEGQITLPDERTWIVTPALVFGSDTGGGKRITLAPQAVAGCEVRDGRVVIRGTRRSQFRAEAMLPPNALRELPTADTVVSLILLHPELASGGVR